MAFIPAALALAVSCSDSDDGGDGVAATGGFSATGGNPVAGGSTSAGGTPGSGGNVMGAGGTVATGGTPSGSGGAVMSGGASSTGGAMEGAGGAAAGAGGTPGSGGDAPSSGGAESGGPLMLMSSVVEAGGMLPSMYRCVSIGGDTGPSPPLAWSGAPSMTLSFAVTLTDVTPGISQDYAHWTLYDIPADTLSLPEGVPAGATLTMPAGAKQSANQASFLPGPGYFGPCGGQNTYEFEVYALDVAALPGVSESSTAAEVRMAIAMHTLESATLSVMSGP